MTSENRIKSLEAPVRMQTQVTMGPQVPKTGFAERVKNGVNAATGFIGNALGVAGASFASTPIVSAAISQIGGLGGGAGIGGGGGVGGGFPSGANVFGGASPAGSALGISNALGPPGIVQTSVATSTGALNGSLGSLGGLGGLGGNITAGTSSGLVSTYNPGTSTTSPSNILNAPLTSTLGTGGTAGGYQTYFSALGQQQYQMLNLQIAMQQEYQFVSTISNVLKTRHDTIKNAISNIR